MRTLLLTFFIAIFTSESCYAQDNWLRSGPMLGFVEMRDACIWFQTTKETDVCIEWRPAGTTGNWMSRCMHTNSYGVGRFELHHLEPGTRYEYKLQSGKGVVTGASVAGSFHTQPLWQYRTDPPEFTMALGSCAFINEENYDRPGTPYGSHYEIFEAIAAANPDLMLWLGDNVYFREVDWNSLEGMVHRYTHSRSLPELQPLLSRCAHYAIWDDHDFGPNDSNGSFIHKDWSQQAFEMFWANPSYGLPGLQGGITGMFTWGDVDFFLLDDRYYRTQWDIKGMEPAILGRGQVQWLIHALSTSRASFKMVCVGSQFLNTEAVYENFSRWTAERQQIIELIEANNIKGVVFLTGDRHCTELSKLTLTNGQTIYDLTVSPFTSGSHDTSKENNTLRVPGTSVATQNFATIQVSGKLKKRSLLIKVFDYTGKEQWQYRIEQP